MKSTLAASATLLAATTLCAQSTKVIPVNLTSAEGNSSSVYHFGYKFPKSQQIWSGSAITSAIAVLNGVKYRRDTNNTSAYPANTYKTATFRLGTTTVTPSTMSQTFASNITSALTTVFSGTWSLPAQPKPTAKPAPFNLGVSWTTPYIYNPQKGSLILEVELPGPDAKLGYFCDAERMPKGTAGVVTPFGSGGAFSSPEVYKFTGNGANFAPGGSLDLRAGDFTKSYTGSLILGISNKTWSGVTLPFDLANVGAPKNNLYVSMDLMFPFSATTTSGPNFASTFRAPIPNNPVYAGVTLYSQAYYSDKNANGLGLVATNALALTTSKVAAPIMQTVGWYNTTATKGNYVFGASATGGPVVQFSGVIP